MLFERRLNIKPSLGGKKNELQSRMLASDRYRTTADTLMEILQKKFPLAFKIIQEIEHNALGQFGMTEPERHTLEMAIQNHSYPFTWKSVQHGDKEFSNIDQVGRYFQIAFKLGKSNKTSQNSEPFTSISDTAWKF